MKFFKQLFGLNKSEQTDQRNEKINQHKLKETLLAKLEPFKRIAYIPTTEKVEPTFSRIQKLEACRI